MKKITGLAFMLMLTCATTFASVTFDVTTGKGFIGKGDVQLLFGWNNAEMQANASSLIFTFTSTDVYEVEAEWWTGPDRKRTYHTVSVTTEIIVMGEVAYEAKTNKNDKNLQITGFILTGWSGFTTSGGDIPELGDNFEGNKTVIGVTLISSEPGTLKVNGFPLLWPAVL